MSPIGKSAQRLRVRVEAYCAASNTINYHSHLHTGLHNSPTLDPYSLTMLSRPWAGAALESVFVLLLLCSYLGIQSTCFTFLHI